jgi:membrane glycosyltransferase
LGQSGSIPNSLCDDYDRADNTARKAGNISEWVTRFGGVYDFMIVLDADSLMSGDNRLVHAMDTNPTAASSRRFP